MEYPKINIRSKNELAKRIARRGMGFKSALSLINDVIEHFDTYWSDYLKQSNPEKGKWVRNASRTPLGNLLRRINKYVLAPYDPLLPKNIFGGVSEQSVVTAARHLLGKKRQRTLLKLDISTFFECNEESHVYDFFKRSGCSPKVSSLLARLCCVHFGPKSASQTGERRVLARGFATSSRLAIWCNIISFTKLNQQVLKLLRKYDPRIAIYVDDIAISASRVPDEKMHSVSTHLASLFSTATPSLPLNTAKTCLVRSDGKAYQGAKVLQKPYEHLGLRLGRNSLSLGTKSHWKLIDVKQRKGKDVEAARSFVGLQRYRRYVSSLGKE